jgi:hypothetical protein
VDERFERRMRRRLAYGFLKERHGEVVVVELSQEDECLGTQRTPRLGEQIRGD